MGRLERLEAWARRLKTELLALYLAYKDPRTPAHARVLAIVVVAYAFSPIDLIPDPIPVLGYLDDLILIPLGIALAVRMTPPDVLTECREEARSIGDRAGPKGTAAAVVVVVAWLLLAALGIYLVSGALGLR
ncbi:MAG: YkvA family protein [Actinomycetota bacterium]|nr:YkvA family protein [Actinomycetota bacterium]